MLTPTTEKYRQVFEQAEKLYQQGPDWVTFFREVLGVEGIVRQAFSTFEELTAFEKSPEYEHIQDWIVKLREKKHAGDGETEPTRVITVRLPSSMHEYLKTEAQDLRTSMNKLCISKLLQVIDEARIPGERSEVPTVRRGDLNAQQPAMQQQPPVSSQPQPQPIAGRVNTTAGFVS